ncbi:MAG: hypothetical protein J6A88_07330 [Oscillospiraceae bacterium]|nr:hypothetical protein [Oscillospiraceae bacterium]
MKKLKSNNDLLNLPILFALSLAGMFLLSCYTSPLYPNYLGLDSAIFSLLGKGIAEGKDLYTDLFDHKGPVIFFINALGHQLGGRNGIFLIQCFSLLVTVTFLYYTGKLLHPKQQYTSRLECIFLFLCFFAFFFRTFEKGNLTEEYALPFITGACFLFVRYLTKANEQVLHPVGYAFFYGCALACLVFLRLNNGVTLCAGILFIFIYLLVKRQYKNLILNLLFGLLGLAAVTVPIILYFVLHGSFDEMIYATFLHNFKIAANTGRDPEVIIPYIPMVLSLGMLLWKVYKTRTVSSMDWFLGLILAINTLSLLIANRFLHYFTVFAPIYLLFLCHYRCYISIKKLHPLFILIVLHLALNGFFVARTTARSVREVFVNGNPRYYTVSSSMTQIPDDEKDSVIGFEIQSSDYLAGGIIPCYKYYTLQNTWSITNPDILQEFIAFVDESEPLWLIINPEYKNAEIDAIVGSKYTYMFENEYMVFYRLK